MSTIHPIWPIWVTDTGRPFTSTSVADYENTRARDTRRGTTCVYSHHQSFLTQNDRFAACSCSKASLSEFPLGANALGILSIWLHSSC
jgi:hypothetical protein